MSAFTQQDKSMAVSFSNLGDNDLLLERISGVERLSALFQFELQMLAERETTIAFDKIIGQPVTIRLSGPGGSIRHINGIVSKLIQGDPVVGNEGDDTFIRYRAIVVPAIYKLTLQTHSRIFQDVSIKSILETVFNDYDVDMQGVIEKFPPRNYCVQYEESDFAFASRLMEQEGIYYYFKHTEKAHQLVLISGKPTGDVQEVSYDPARDSQSPERILTLNKMQQLTAGNFTVWDYHFQNATSNLNATVQVSNPVTVGTVSHSFELGDNSKIEDYRHGDFAHHFDEVKQQGSTNSQALADLHKKNIQQATLRMERSMAAALTLEGQSTCPTFQDGALIEVPNHYQGQTSLLLTEVRHEASIEGAFTSLSNPPLTYTNHFKAIPADLQYRPQLTTPRPRIQGCQTAMVIATDNSDVTTDSYGRVQVQFYWDCWGQSSSNRADGNPSLGYHYWDNRREGPNSCSCWLRIGQSWAGSGYGTQFTPRKAMEVLITFADGDPDRPFIVGCAYNSRNAPPFDLPKDAAATGWKSKTLGGDETMFNGLAFVDTKGAERVYLQSEGNLIIRTEGDLIFDVGGKILTNHAGTQRETVGNLPAMSSGSGGGEPCVLNDQSLGSGAGGADKSQAGTFEAWKLTGAGAGWANEYGVTWGNVLKTSVGMSGSIAIPVKYDILIDPFTLYGDKIPASKLTSVLSDLFTGSRKLYMCSTSDFIYGVKNDILLQKKNSWELGGPQGDPVKAKLKEAFEYWAWIVGTLVLTEVGTMGFVSDLHNHQEAANLLDNVCAALIVAECVGLQTVLERALMTAGRLKDVMASAETIAQQLADLKTKAAKDAADNAAKQKKEVQDIIDQYLPGSAYNSRVAREIQDGLTHLKTGADVLFNMTGSAKMQCNDTVAAPPTSSYVSVLPSGASLGLATGDPLTSTEVAVSAANVNLSVGPLLGATTACIMMNATEIVLMYGPLVGGSAISINAEGVTIMAPKLTIVTPDGVSITSATTKIVGEVSITGQTSVTGATTFTGNLDLTGDLDVTGPSSLIGDLAVSGTAEFI